MQIFGYFFLLQPKEREARAGGRCKKTKEIWILFAESLEKYTVPYWEIDVMEYENYSNNTNKTETSIHSVCVVFVGRVRSLLVYCAREISSKMSVFGRNSECEKNNRIQLALQF